MTRRIRSSSRIRTSGKAGTLSLRERQCLELAAQGKSNWAIGQILQISQHTVHRHVESAKHRLGVATRVQAIVRAFQSHQIFVGDPAQSDPKLARRPTR
jgi:DNA-binding CsgD family transcriptional regulator